MASSAQLPYDQLAAWPRCDDGSVVVPGDTVKLPGGGAVVHVVSVSFGQVSRGAYVNGFYIDKSERMERFERRG